MIDKLTPEQLAMLPLQVEKWTAIGLSTQKHSDEEIQEAVRLAYAAASLSVPPIYRVKGPREGLKLTEKLTGKEDFSYFLGQFEAGWLSYYDTFAQFGLENEVASLSGLIALAKCASFVWFYDEACIVAGSPSVIARDPQGRLHSPSGPAILFDDGFAIYAINGVVVPKQVVMAPEKLTLKAITQESNAEVRRVMIERYGPAKFLKQSKAKKRNEDAYGVLWDLPHDPTISICEVINSTAERDGIHKTYYLTVPRRMRCAHEAVANSFGRTMETYHPSAQS